MSNWPELLLLGVALLDLRAFVGRVRAAGPVVANQIALTIADVVAEAHDVHHPISVGLYYEDQKDASAAAAAQFRDGRLARWLGHFESILRNNDEVLVGDEVSYCDISLAHLLDGLEYAFPRAFESLSGEMPRSLALRDRVRDRPNIASYLSSPRRIDFNEDGIFRHYAELDGSVEV